MKDTLLFIIKDYAIFKNGTVYINKHKECELVKQSYTEYALIDKFNFDTKIIIDDLGNEVKINCYDLVITNNPSIINRIKPKYSILVTNDINSLNQTNKDLNVFQVNNMCYALNLINILFDLNDKMWKSKGECLCY